MLFVSVNKKSSKVFIKFFFVPILLCAWLALTIQQVSEVAYLSTRQVLGNILLSVWVLASLSLNKPLKIALLSDYLNKKKVKVFGPSKFASQLEGSKAFMKNLCKKLGQKKVITMKNQLTFQLPQ